VEDESSLELLASARAGDRDALDRLLARQLPRLRRWATGRLPSWARDRGDTEDLVQESVIQTLRKLDGFEPRHEGALQAYLRQAVMNAIRDALRRAGRRPAVVPLAADLRDRDASPLEQAIGGESIERYEAALTRLREQDREAVIARVELGYSYDELAEVLGKPTPEAARMAVTRAMRALAEQMSHGPR